MMKLTPAQKFAIFAALKEVAAAWVPYPISGSVAAEQIALIGQNLIKQLESDS